MCVCVCVLCTGLSLVDAGAVVLLLCAITYMTLQVQRRVKTRTLNHNHNQTLLVHTLSPVPFSSAAYSPGQYSARTQADYWLEALASAVQAHSLSAHGVCVCAGPSLRAECGRAHT